MHVIYITIFYIICIIILQIIYIITYIYAYYKRSYADAVRYDNTSTNTSDLSKIYCELLACEKSNSSNSGTCPPDICTNSAEVSNSSNSQLVKIIAMSFLHKMRKYFLFCRNYNRIRHLRQTIVANVFVGISAQTQFLI